MLRLRNGLSGTNTAERLALLYVERWCSQQAVQLAYLTRLDASGTVLVDAQDLKVTCCSVRWGRKKGLLYVVCKVTVSGSDAVQEFRLRVPARPLAARQMQVWRDMDL